MATYQNRDEEAESLLISNKEETVDTHPQRKWAVSVLALVVTVALGAFVVSYKSQKTAPSTELLGISRVYFKGLGDDEVLSLWKDYKIQFGKSVSKQTRLLVLDTLFVFFPIFILLYIFIFIFLYN
jgi:heme/copper-type cytochrome/quinol oxidase subunit 2